MKHASCETKVVEGGGGGFKKELKEICCGEINWKMITTW